MLKEILFHQDKKNQKLRNIEISVDNWVIRPVPLFPLVLSRQNSSTVAKVEQI